MDIAKTYTANIGTPAYMAPELLDVESETSRYSSAIDMCV
jgi:serine/threonine protein kinase